MLSDFSTTLENAKLLLAEATEVQSFLQVDTAEAAAAKIHKGYQTNSGGTESLPAMVIALIDWTSEKTSISSWNGTQSIVLSFRDSAAQSSLAQSKYTGFIESIEPVLDGMREDSSELAKLNVVNIEMSVPPRIMQEEDNGDRIDSVLVAEFILQCFG